MWNSIKTYFYEHPMDLFYIFGTSGGVSYWISLFRNRIRLKVYCSPSYFLPTPTAPGKKNIKFEIENVGRTGTSLAPEVRVKGFIRNSSRSFIFVVDTGDRNLPPFVPKKFTATTQCSEDLFSLLFPIFKISLSRGKSKMIRCLCVGKPRCKFIRYYWYRFLWRVLKRELDFPNL
jgi:hypothetical protein